MVVKKYQNRVVITQLRVVNKVVKRGLIRVVITVVKKD